MSDKTAVEGTDPAWIKRLAEARGLGLAHTLFPEVVAAAMTRASTALSPLPPDFSPTTEPAVTFDPADTVGPRSSETSSTGTNSGDAQPGDTHLDDRRLGEPI